MGGFFKDFKQFKKFCFKELKLKRHYKVKLIKSCATLFVNGAIGYDEPVVAFGAFNEKFGVIIPIGLRGKIKEQLFVTLGHELTHAWQHENNLETSEEQADTVGEELYNKWRSIKTFQ